MSRIVPLLTLFVACSLAACGDDGDKVQILLFQASPDAIEAGQSTKLVFVVQPATAKITISGGVGDVTGKTEVPVSPTDSTSYQLTAVSGSATTNQTVKVTVGPTSATSIKLEAASKTPTAGDAFAVTVTALAADGNPAPGFRGTVRIGSTDTTAVLPPDIAFTAAEAGTKQVMVTLKAAGVSTLTATDTSSKAGVAGSASLTVQPAAAHSYRLGDLPASAAAGDGVVLTITVLDVFGNVATSYHGSVHLTSSNGGDQLPQDSAFTAGVQTVSLQFTTTGNRIVTVHDAAGSLPALNASLIAIGPAAAARVAVNATNASTTAGAAEPLAVTAFDRFGNVATGYTGTVHFTSTDASAVLPADFTFTSTDAGTHSFTVTLKTAGTSSVSATDVVTGAFTASAAWTVSPATASSFVLSVLPPSATAGDALVLTITVKDPFDNVATGFGGLAVVTSGDDSDVLPPTGGFAGGVRSVSLVFTKAGSHTVTVSDPGGGIGSATTSSVAIVAGRPVRVAVTSANPTTTAGTSEGLTTRVVDQFGNTCMTYLGTVHFAANDAQAVLPADFTFTGGDAGAHGFNVTLKTSGTTTVAVSDTALTGVSGSATWQVSAAAATTCRANQAPATATAGTVVGLTVAVRDPFGNVANGYAGTIQLTASDARANLPGNVTYVPSNDAGSHAFSVALLTTGSQTVTATDVANPAISCNLGIAITPAAPKLLLGLPTDANAGYPVNVSVTVKDLFDNAIPAYAGTVTFTSTDTGTGAVTPPPITFTGSEGGATTTTATFVTIGSQTLSASDAGAPQASGTTVAKIHGLVYTGPTTGRVRLVANGAQSSPQTIQLDLVANERLEVSSLFGGPGSFSAGMNLPLDTTRVGAGNPLFTRGPALPTGTGVAASVAVLGSDHVLYTGVSRKRVTGTAIGTQDTDVAAGQVFYSVRLKLTQAGVVGTVFDGAQPMAMFRAAVRDQFGNDFVGQSDIGVGKLEIQ